MNELTTQNYVVTPAGTFDMSPRNLQEAYEMCDRLAQSDFVPRDYQKKPGNILVAVQWGAEIGLKPMQALVNIAVINGRPSLWGDAVIALVRSSSVCEYVLEGSDGDTAWCKVKRRGEPEQVRTFSMADAKAAGLAGKSGPWSQYPARMRQMRARAFALRDVFPDVLKGLPVAEEVIDMPSIEREPKAAPADRYTPSLSVSGEIPLRREREEQHEKMIESLELLAFNRGSQALAAAWAKLSKEDRVAIGADELTRIKRIAVEADEIIAAAKDAEAEAALLPDAELDEQ